MLSKSFWQSEKNRNSTWVVILLLLAIGLLDSQTVQAQRVRGESFVIPGNQLSQPIQPIYPANGGFNSPQLLQNGQQVFSPPMQQQSMVPATPIMPNLQQGFAGGQLNGQQGGQLMVPGQMQPPVVLQQPQQFDPFAIQTQPPLGATIISPMPPQGGVMLPGSFPTQSVQPPPFIYPPPANQQYPNAQLGVPNLGGPGYGYPQGYPQGGYGYNGSNGSWSNSASAWPNQAWARLRSSNFYRLLERPRWRHTYLSPSGFSGTKGLGLNESEIATTLTLPNFLYTSQPFRISPGFIFHFWEGPNTVLTGADLPGTTYSGYLSTDFTTPWNRQVGAEVNLTVGIYTDLKAVSSDSIRLTGLGLGWYRLNNTTTFKAGVEYLDRVRVKLLPAVGFFIYPTNDLKIDLFFPRPKIAHRLQNLGNYEVWAYLGGEYGGGSWTIERLAGFDDQVDMNDIRVLAGFEWMGPRRVTGFVEGGYVFDRELIYRSFPNTEIDIDDTYMFRAGIAF